MMIGMQRDEDKNVSAADSAEQAETNGEEINTDPIPECMIEHFHLVCRIP